MTIWEGEKKRGKEGGRGRERDFRIIRKLEIYKNIRNQLFLHFYDHLNSSSDSQKSID